MSRIRQFHSRQRQQKYVTKCVSRVTCVAHLITPPWYDIILGICLRSRPLDPNVVCPLVRSWACWNDMLMGWLDDRMTGWQNDWLTEWRDHQMTGWPDDRITGWPVDRMTRWLDDRKLRRRLTVWYIFRGDVAELQIDPLYDSIGIVH